MSNINSPFSPFDQRFARANVTRMAFSGLGVTATRETEDTSWSEPVYSPPPPPPPPPPTAIYIPPPSYITQPVPVYSPPPIQAVPIVGVHTSTPVYTTQPAPIYSPPPPPPGDSYVTEVPITIALPDGSGQDDYTPHPVDTALDPLPVQIFVPINIPTPAPNEPPVRPGTPSGSFDTGADTPGTSTSAAENERQQQAAEATTVEELQAVLTKGTSQLHMEAVWRYGKWAALGLGILYFIRKM